MDHGQGQTLPVEAGQRRPTYEEIAQVIECPQLHPTITDDEVIRACRMAREYRFAALLVKPTDVELAARHLGDSETAIAAPVGFPDGMSTTAAKLYEGRDLVRRGAKEIDFTLNIGKMLGRQFQYVEMELLQMAKSCAESGARLKVDLAARYLNRDLKIIALKICKRVEAQFAGIEAHADDLALLLPMAKDRIGLKIVTNVPSLQEVLALHESGARRMACTNAASILEEFRSRLAAEEKAAGESSTS